MITIEDNKKKFEVGDMVELDADSSKFKKGSIFVVMPNNNIIQGFNMTTVRSLVDNRQYFICNDYLKLYKSNKKGSKDKSISSQVFKELGDGWKILNNENKILEFITISRGIFKGQKCEIISEEDKTYTIRLLEDSNFNIIKINKSDLYVQNEHKPEEGLYLNEYKYKIQGSKTTLMNKENNILASTVCDESDMFDKNKALEICRYKYLIKKYQKMIKIYQKELNILINE